MGAMHFLHARTLTPLPQPEKRADSACFCLHIVLLHCNDYTTSQQGENAGEDMC